MIHVGSYIRELRTELGKSLKEVSDSLDISVDQLSKIERGERKPTPKLITSISSYFEVSEKKLLEFYYSDEIIEILDDYENSESVLRLVRKRLINPNFKYPTSKSKFLKTKDSLKPKRSYTKGGKGGKFKGFDYYIQSNGKITKNKREDVVERSEGYFSEVKSQFPHNYIPSDIPSELDPSLTDYELMDIWNTFYDTHGGQISDFRNKYEREILREEPSDSNNTNIVDSKEEEIKRNLFNEIKNRGKRKDTGLG